MPRKEARADVRVHGIAEWAIGQAQVQHCRGVTALRGSQRNVEARRRGGRARWKMANATVQTLQNQGDHWEHHAGHGEPHRAVVCAMLLLRAFLVDHTQQLCCALCRAVGTKRGSKRVVWERMRALFYDYRLASRRELCEALLEGFETSPPVWRIDTAASLAVLLRCGAGELGDCQSSRPWSIQRAKTAASQGNFMSVWLSTSLAADQNRGENCSLIVA